MKILIVGKNISVQDSLDYINIVKPLLDLGHTISTYDILAEKHQNSNNINNLCEKSLYELIFFIPVENEIDFNFVKNLSKKHITIAYLYDDSWRIKYSLEWANSVRYVVSSDINWRINFQNITKKVIYAPFFVNTDFYKPIPKVEKKYEVTFVGQYHPSREWVINIIRNSGIDVKVFGKGWYNGSEISYEKMIEVFNESKVNLNLSNCLNYDIRHLLDFKNNKIISLLKSYKMIFMSYFKNDMKIYEMVKARFFEINACQGFQISFYAQGLEHQYLLGEEIEIFENTKQLLSKINFYLKNQDLRDRISKQGYKKTTSNHDSKIRLNYIFSQIEFIKTIND